jgi:hypothetical protein
VRVRTEKETTVVLSRKELARLFIKETGITHLDDDGFWMSLEVTEEGVEMMLRSVSSTLPLNNNEKEKTRET